MERWIGTTAMVTGAGGGIGSAVAVSLANLGMNVVGIDINSKLVNDLKLKIIGTGSLHARTCDVSNPEEVRSTFEWTKNTFGGVDVMINCAGVVYHGSITDLGPHPLTVEELMQQLDVNVKSVVLFSREAASSMSQRSFQGHIININSIIGHFISSSPIFNTYCASKHAITAITKTLQVELSNFNSNIKISSVSPSLVRTKMAEMQKMPELAASVSSAPSLKPQDVADAILYLLSTPSHVNVEELTIAPVGDIRL